MEEALEMARAKDTKERMAGVERLHQVLEATTKSLSTAEVTALVDACMDLLKDSNFRVSQGALQALSAAAVLSGEHLKLHFNGLVPAVVERLGDGKQPVRDAARQLLITLMEVSSLPSSERAGSYAWTHRSWRVREEFARTVTTAIGLFASTELPLQRVLQLLTDSNQSVREAATLCIEEMYAQGGPQFREELHRHHLPSSMLKEINARLEKIEPKVQPSDGVGISYVSAETRPSSANHKKSSPKTKMAPRETSFSSGDIDAPEKPVAPIKVYSEKELMREMEKIASTLVPEKDWSLRIAAMQRVESLIINEEDGGVDAPSTRDPLQGPKGILEITQNFEKKTEMAIEHESSVLTPRLDISRLICNINDVNSSSEKQDALQQLVEVSLKNDTSVWTKVSNEANQCLNIILSQFDPFRFLSVIVPLLISDDEKTLTVVFCLVEIYIMLGKSFLPYLEGLSSTQLRLVTIYANRISQARSGAPIDH
ncbi:HEAT repeat family protein [Musa troglodytarum]|uniref:HEAT repeat family protein n=1 Tax=Musa troglodytarum TaxID=320322 RepID=A0A9E7EKE1_9LILI|nr:HEAT repeat family protein [Musa troglodytarum]